MVKKTLLVALLAFSISIVAGQSLSTKKDKNDADFISLDSIPTTIVVVDSVQYTIDSKKADDIKTKWISKIVVIKDEPIEKMYGNKNGVILIYAKEEYWDDVLKEIENE